jgi:hypothetical protein
MKDRKTGKGKEGRGGRRGKREREGEGREGKGEGRGEGKGSKWGEVRFMVLGGGGMDAPGRPALTHSCLASFLWDADLIHVFKKDLGY